MSVTYRNLKTGELRHLRSKAEAERFLENRSPDDWELVSSAATQRAEQ